MTMLPAAMRGPSVLACAQKLLQVVSAGGPASSRSKRRARSSLMLQHTSAYVSIRQHTSAYVSIRAGPRAAAASDAHAAACRRRFSSIRQHTFSHAVSLRPVMRSAYVSIRSAYVQSYVSIRQHTSAYVSIRQHTSAYVSIPVAAGALRQCTAPARPPRTR
jgi:hypothetical protein